MAVCFVGMCAQFWRTDKKFDDQDEEEMEMNREIVKLVEFLEDDDAEENEFTNLISAGKNWLQSATDKVYI